MKYNFFKTLSLMFIANGISALAKWLIIIIIAKILSVSDVGKYSLAFAITAPIALFVQMKLRSLYVTEENINYKVYLRVRLIANLVAFFLIFLTGLLFYKEYLIVILLIGLSKLLDLNSEIYYALPHKAKNLNLVAKLIIFKSILQISTFYFGLLMSNNLEISLLASLVFQYLFLIFFEKKILFRKYKIVKKSKLVNIKDIKLIMLSALPLGVVAMIYSFTINTPRYVLEYFNDAETLGYFSAIMYIVTITNIFQVAMSQIFLPKLSKLYVNKEMGKFSGYFWGKLMIASFSVGVVLIIIIFIFDKYILMTLYGSEYVAYYKIFDLAIVAVFINMISGNLDTALMATRSIKKQPLILASNFIFTIIICFILIKNFGILGASYSLIVSNSSLLIMRYLLLKKTMNKLGRKINVA